MKLFETSKIIFSLIVLTCFFEYQNFFFSQKVFAISASKISQIPRTQEQPPEGNSRRSGGTKRGGNEDNSIFVNPENKLLAIIPVTEATLRSVASGYSLTEWEKQANPIDTLGMTLDPNPYFWFYIPELNNNSQDCQASLELEDINQPQTDPKRFLTPESLSVTLSKSGGIFGFRLADQYQLEIDKIYKWTFTVDCSTESEYVYGIVQRFSGFNSLSSEIAANQDNLQYLFQLYWNNHQLWHDAATLLFENRQQPVSQRNQYLENQLRSLLEDKTVDLRELIDVEVLGKYTLE